MPTLREYKPSSKKSGYYIQANVGGSHPITLQVTKLAQAILQQTGYKPNESVPTKLVWAMYDLDLLYTKKSLNPNNVKNVSTEDVLRKLNLGNRLSQSQIRNLVTHIEEYEGPQKLELNKLKESLITANNSDRIKNKVENKHLSKLEDVPKTIDEALSYLFTMTYNIKKYQKAKTSMDKVYLLQSLQTFIPHPYADAKAAKVTERSLLSYPITSPDGAKNYYLTDRRISHANYPAADYVLLLPDEEKNTEVYIKDQSITEIVQSASNPCNFEAIEDSLDWILPPNPIERGEIAYKKKDNLRDSIFTEYGGLKLLALQEVEDKETINVCIVEVDRISTSGNPVIIVDGKERILTEGHPEEKYLVEDTGEIKWKTLSRVIE